jgi:hypothetical protein
MGIERHMADVVLPGVFASFVMIMYVLVTKPTNFRFLLFAKAFLAVTSHFSTYRHFFELLCPAILGFSFRSLRKKASFAQNFLS